MLESQLNITATNQQQTFSQPKVSSMLSAISAAFGTVGEAVCAQEQQYEKRIATLQQAIPSNTNIVADQKRKELIAVLNAIYESGMIDKDNVTKAEFFKRQAIAYGDPQLADYARQLSQIMNSSKYEDIFNQVSSAGIEFRTNKENSKN